MWPRSIIMSANTSGDGHRHADHASLKPAIRQPGSGKTREEVEENQVQLVSQEGEAEDHLHGVWRGWAAADLRSQPWSQVFLFSLSGVLGGAWDSAHPEKEVQHVPWELHGITGRVGLALNQHSIDNLSRVSWVVKGSGSGASGLMRFCWSQTQTQVGKSPTFPLC